MRLYGNSGIAKAVPFTSLLYIFFLFIVYISIADGNEIGNTGIHSGSYLRGYADVTTLNAKPEDSHGKIYVENIWSIECAGVITSDFYRALSSPLRWRNNDLTKFYLGTLSTVVVAGVYDPEVRKIAQSNRSRTSDDMAKFLNRLGSSYPSWILSSFYLGGLIFKNPTAKMVGIDGLAATLITSAAVVPFTKQAFGRVRPNEADDQFEFDSFSGHDSFPSGHTARAFVTATVIASHYDQFWVKATAYALAGMVAYARLNNNVHWGSDVVGGALIGITIGQAVVHFNMKLRSKK